MSGPITAEQQFEFLAKLGANLNWSKFTREEIQIGIREAQRVGEEMGFFMKSGYRASCADTIRRYLRDTSEFDILIPAMDGRERKEANKKYSEVDAVGDFHYWDCPNLGPVQLTLATVLLPVLDDDGISCSEARRRKKLQKTPSLGLAHAEWLLANYANFPELAALLQKRIHVQFWGAGIRNNIVGERFPMLYLEDGKPTIVWGYESHKFTASSRIAVAKWS